MRISLEIAIAIISAIVALIAVWLSLQSNRQSQRSTIREATEVIFKEWWSEEFRELRKYFFLEFIPKHRAKLTGKGMKDIDQVIRVDKGRARQFCYFFDRVGWLGAAGLIDVDYVLGPMQQSMRRAWIVMEPLILKERIFRPNEQFDPVFQYGFEWLFRRSSQSKNHQAYLLGYRFSRPHIRTRKQIRELRAQIDMDEANFRREISVLEKVQTKHTN